jgi:hypothetical protein
MRVFGGSPFRSLLYSSGEIQLLAKCVEKSNKWMAEVQEPDVPLFNRMGIVSRKTPQPQ